MGSGKTTVGRIAAEELGIAFLDTDAEIEEGQGRSIKSIFEDYGEDWFRKAECLTLDSLVRQAEPAIVALGGGTLIDPQNLARIRPHGLLVYLRLSLDELAARLTSQEARPLYQPHEIDTLFAQRRPAYLKADATIDVGHLSSRVAGRQVAGIFQSMQRGQGSAKV